MMVLAGFAWWPLYLGGSCSGQTPLSTAPKQAKDALLRAEAREEIRAVLARHGRSDVEIGNPRTTLEDLFLDVVRDTQARPGRRARQASADGAQQQKG